MNITSTDKSLFLFRGKETLYKGYHTVKNSRLHRFALNSLKALEKTVKLAQAIIRNSAPYTEAKSKLKTIFINSPSAVVFLKSVSVISAMTLPLAIKELKKNITSYKRQKSSTTLKGIVQSFTWINTSCSSAFSFVSKIEAVTRPARAALTKITTYMSLVTAVLLIVESAISMKLSYNSYKDSKNVKELLKNENSLIAKKIGLEKFDPDEKVDAESIIKKMFISKSLSHALQATAALITAIAIPILTLTPFIIPALGLIVIGASVALSAVVVDKYSIRKMSKELNQEHEPMNKTILVMIGLTLTSIPVILIGGTVGISKT